MEGDPCITPDGRSGYLVASGDNGALVCQLPDGTTSRYYQVFAKQTTTETQLDARD